MCTPELQMVASTICPRGLVLCWGVSTVERFASPCPYESHTCQPLFALCKSQTCCLMHVAQLYLYGANANLSTDPSSISIFLLLLLVCAIADRQGAAGAPGSPGCSSSRLVHPGAAGMSVPAVHAQHRV
jgi:hypothetical protein